MKKTFLTGVAALLLATGCSHRLDLDGFTSLSKEDECIVRRGSPEERFCSLREPPNTPSTQHIEDMLKQYIWTFRPPPQYDKPFDGTLVTRYLDDDEIKHVCRPGSIACSMWFPGAGTGIDHGLCILMLPKNESLIKRGIEPDEVYRHEIGHCNGWPGDHGGATWKRVAQ